MYIYEKPILFEQFFKLLGCKVVYSKDTDKVILNNGLKFSIDESCLASKIYIGHVNDLVKRRKHEGIDYIFIPRICTFNNNEDICVKFYAMYDICRNVFNANFITLNIDYKDKNSELRAFLQLGKKLNFKYSNIILAYIKARNMQRLYDLKKLREQYKNLAKFNGIKKNILIVSHPYIENDKYIGKPIINYLKKFDVNVMFSDINSSNINNTKLYTSLSKSIYWKSSKNLINGILEYKNYIDGIIYLTVFPCGPDSLVNEILVRKITNIPSINIIVDEQEIGAGIYTRLESFLDILNQDDKKVSGK